MISDYKHLNKEIQLTNNSLTTHYQLPNIKTMENTNEFSQNINHLIPPNINYGEQLNKITEQLSEFSISTPSPNFKPESPVYGTINKTPDYKPESPMYNTGYNIKEKKIDSEYSPRSRYYESPRTPDTTSPKTPKTPRAPRVQRAPREQRSPRPSRSPRFSRRNLPTQQDLSNLHNKRSSNVTQAFIGVQKPYLPWVLGKNNKKLFNILKDAKNEMEEARFLGCMDSYYNVSSQNSNDESITYIIIELSSNVPYYEIREDREGNYPEPITYYIMDRIEQLELEAWTMDIQGRWNVKSEERFNNNRYRNNKRYRYRYNNRDKKTNYYNNHDSDYEQRYKRYR